MKRCLKLSCERDFSRQKNSSKVIKTTCAFENLYQDCTQVPALASVNFTGSLSAEACDFRFYSQLHEGKKDHQLLFDTLQKNL